MRHTLAKRRLERVIARVGGRLSHVDACKANKRPDKIQRQTGFSLSARTRLVELKLMQKVITVRAGVGELYHGILCKLPLNAQGPLNRRRYLERVASCRETQRENRRVGGASRGIAQKSIVDADSLIRLGVRESVLFDDANQTAVVVNTEASPHSHLPVTKGVPRKADPRSDGVIG